MLTKMVDFALSATFLAVNILSRFRNYLRSGTPVAREEDRLIAAVIEARRKRLALQGELYRPTSRLYAAQVKLSQATRAAGATCQGLIVAWRGHRRTDLAFQVASNEFQCSEDPMETAEAAYLGGLDIEATIFFKAHLETCARCRQVYGETVEFVDAMRTAAKWLGSGDGSKPN